MLSSDLSTIQIDLYGNFRIGSARGANLTPIAAKAQALVALLATSPNGERSRQWLQSKLWSDRAPQQASASLRQALVQTRKALGAEECILIATRQRISLDLDRINIEPPNGGEFLEGIDVRDQEFEYWLANERVSRAADVPTIAANLDTGPQTVLPQIGWTIAVDVQGGDSDISRWFGALYADAVARHMREFFSARVVVGDPPETEPGLWVVQVHATLVGGNCLGLRVSLEHPATRRQIWAGHRHVPLKGAPPIEHPEVFRLSNELVEALGDSVILDGYVDAPVDDPDRLCRQALRALFTMKPDAVAQADQMFADAYEMRKRGLYLAWRAQIRTIQRVERHSDNWQALVDEGEHFCAKSLELEPNNSMVLATLANTLGHLMRDPEASLDMAKRSVLLNPANPMGWWALSSANVYSGNVEDSYTSAVNARNLAILSPHRFWWDNQQFGAAVVLGRLDEAMRLSEAAMSQNRDFRPPLRYLVAFYANAGREEDAIRVAEKLKLIEPDFSIERLVKDREYPASLIHRAPGLDLEKLASLG